MARDEGFEEDDFPRRKRKGKGISRKRLGLLLAIIALLALGAVFQHYMIEPAIGSGISEKYAMCLTQKDVLDERFVECSNSKKACEYQLQQCTGT